MLYLVISILNIFSKEFFIYILFFFSITLYFSYFIILRLKIKVMRYKTGLFAKQIMQRGNRKIY